MQLNEIGIPCHQLEQNFESNNIETELSSREKLKDLMDSFIEYVSKQPNQTPGKIKVLDFFRDINNSQSTKKDEAAGTYLKENF